MDVPDMDVIREIPGYKVILKAVLKAQIQQLVEQLATTTSEESIILTASVADGTLSHLGSELAKGFLEDHEDVKSQFLGYCLKRQHKKEQEAEEKKRQEIMNSRLLSSPPQHSYIPGPSRNTKAWPRGPGPGYPGRGGIKSPGVRHEPYPQMSYPSPRASSSSAPATTVKQEPQDTSTDSFIDSEKVNQSKLCSEDDNQSNSANSTAGGSETDNDQSEHGAEVKVEASESDLELEITGVEPGTPAVSQSWSPSNMPFDPNIGATGTAADQQTQKLSGKRKRNDLSLGDKYEVVKLLEQKISQTEIAKKLRCSQSQVSRILSNKESIKAKFETKADPDRKRHRSGKDAEVEAALSAWLTKARSHGVPLSGPVLMQKAVDLARQLNKDNFKPSAGWLSRWKERNSVVFKKVHGKQRQANVEAANK